MRLSLATLGDFAPALIRAFCPRCSCRSAVVLTAEIARQLTRPVVPSPDLCRGRDYRRALVASQRRRHASPPTVSNRCSGRDVLGFAILASQARDETLALLALVRRGQRASALQEKYSHRSLRIRHRRGTVAVPNSCRVFLRTNGSGWAAWRLFLIFPPNLLWNIHLAISRSFNS